MLRPTLSEGRTGRTGTLAVVLIAAIFLTAPVAVGGYLVAPETPDTPLEEARYVVGFHVMPKGMEIGGTYEGGEIVNVNDAIQFVAVLTEDPVGFELRASLDDNVRYVEPSPWRQLIVESPGVPFERELGFGDDDGVGALFTPNDPQYGSMYGPQQTRVNLAWDTTLGNAANAAVCVGDTGVRATHEDITGTRWLGGRDFINNDNDPSDDNGHGTHVAGTAAASINNAKGVAGMGNVGIYAVKVLNSAGSGTWDQVASGITWCADNTMARTVISLSLGASSGQQVLADAVAYAYNTRGKLVVAAAGNSGPCSNCVGYPAKYTQAMAVTCTTSTEALCSFSSTGPEAELAAPGNGIVSTWHTSNTAYNTISGTSMSTPHVSGIAALYWSWDTGINNAGLRTRLQNTPKDLGTAGRDNSFGYGRVDAKCLFDNTSPCGTAPPPPGCSGGPSNNCFASPTAASGSTYTNTQSTTGATTESGEPAPCGLIKATVWYTYTPSASGTMTVETVGSNYDTVVAAYTGSTLTGLTNVACNDDISSTNLQSRITFTATAGVTYRLQAGGYNGATGSLTFKITGPASCTGPSNNCFASPTAITTKPSTLSQSTAGATLETSEPRPCGAIGATVWYTYTPTTTGTLVFDTFTSSYDTVLAVYTGSTLTGLTNVACNDDTAGSGNGLQSRVSFTGTAGVTYRIQAGGYNGATGTLVLRLN